MGRAVTAGLQRWLTSRGTAATPYEMTASAREGVRTLISVERLRQRVQELGAEITRDYAGSEPVLVALLKGSFMFCADLARAIELPVTIEFLGVQSYGDNTHTTGVVQITQDLTRPIAGQHVIIIEDIVDTGLTLTYIYEQLVTRGPRSVKICSLLHKPDRMRKPVDISYLGFSIEDVFVVGYGLDYAQRYRNLPDICVVEAV